MGRPVVQRHDRRYAPLPEPDQGSLVRDDELQGHRPPSGPPDHHRVEVDVDGAADAGAGEGEIRSAIHNKAAPALFPDDFPETPAVNAGDFHLDCEFVVVVVYCLKKRVGLVLKVRGWSEESRVRLCLHVLQGDPGPSVLCEWDLRRVTSRTI